MFDLDLTETALQLDRDRSGLNDITLGPPCPETRLTEAVL